MNAAMPARWRLCAHDVVYVAESQRGAADPDVLRRADSEQRILLTEDKDFGELVYRLRRPAHGIVLLRFDVAQRTLKIPRLRSLVAIAAERLPGTLVVLEATKTRFRPLL